MTNEELKRAQSILMITLKVTDLTKQVDRLTSIIESMGDILNRTVSLAELVQRRIIALEDKAGLNTQ
jgi:hypothetical protein